MSGAIEVSDSLSNAEEQLERAAKVLGRSDARKSVFEAIYRHKAQVKTVGEIADRTRLPRMRVLQEGRRLAGKGIVRQTQKSGDTAYAKIDFFTAHKAEILRLVADPGKLAQLPTKRKVVVRVPKYVRISLKAISHSGGKPITVPEGNRLGVGAKRRWHFNVANTDRDRQVNYYPERTECHKPRKGRGERGGSPCPRLSTQ